MGAIPIAPETGNGLAFDPVNVYEAFRASLQAWLDVTGLKRKHLADLAQINKGTVTHLLTPGKTVGVEFGSLERFRVGLNVPAYALFSPEAMVAALSDVRLGKPVRFVDQPGSAILPEVASMSDRDLFRKLLGYWAAMDPSEKRLLVQNAWQLSQPDADSPASDTGPRKNAQG